MNSKEAIELGRARGAAMVDLKFVDLLGRWQHTRIPFRALDEGLFEDGVGIDADSVQGFQGTNQGEILLVPDAATALMDPFAAHPTLSLECFVQDPITRQPFSRDPRHISRKAEAHLRSTGIADTALFAAESAFFVLEDVRYASRGHEAFFRIDSTEASWNTEREEGPNLGHKIRAREGRCPVPPQDACSDLRTELALVLQHLGIQVTKAQHAVASAGHNEIGLNHDSLARVADQILWFKYVVKNVAHRAGRTATFMPRPLGDDAGSGLHLHQSLWKAGKPLFAGDGYGGLSELALYYVGGILRHARALSALTNPTTNSFRRLVPGVEAPVNLSYSSRNRSAAVRMSTYSMEASTRRIETRFPDATSNPHLALAALLMAGLDGIQNRIDPGDPLDKDIYALSPEELRNVPGLPTSLEEALLALEDDHAFLLRGDVFTPDVIAMWLDLKRAREVQPSRRQPTPLEYVLYFDA